MSNYSPIFSLQQGKKGWDFYDEGGITPRNSSNFSLEERLMFINTVFKKCGGFIAPTVFKLLDGAMNGDYENVEMTQREFSQNVSNIIGSKDEAELLLYLEKFMKSPMFESEDFKKALLKLKNESAEYNSTFLQKRVAWLLRFFLSGRYNIEIHGMEHLEHYGPVSLLWQHKGLYDPMMIISLIAEEGKVRPVVFEDYYENVILKPLLKWIRSIPVGNTSKASWLEAVAQLHTTVVHAQNDLTPVLWYPSGKLPLEWTQHTWAASLTHDVVNDSNTSSNTKYLSFRFDNGLWGSISSHGYWDGDLVNFFKVAMLSGGISLANGIFFGPKKDMNIYIENITDLVHKNKWKSRLEFNAILDNYVNQHGEEPINFTPHFDKWHPLYYLERHLTKDKTEPLNLPGSQADLRNTNDYDLSEVSDEVKSDINAKIAEIAWLNLDKVNSDSKLENELWMKSIALWEMKSYLVTSNKYPKCVAWSSFESLKTVEDIYAVALWLLPIPPIKECEWGKLSNEPELLLDTLMSGWNDINVLIQANLAENPDDTFLWDDALWMLTKIKVKTAISKLAMYIKWIPGNNIGVMLPPSSWATIITAAVLKAGKTPVMLNFTLPEEKFIHTLENSWMSTILTSRVFVDKYKEKLSQWDNINPLVATLDRMTSEWAFSFLEDVKEKGASIWWKVTIISNYIRWQIRDILRTSSISAKLFTSGSTSNPKEVDLTDSNLIENLKWALSYFDLRSDDIMLSALPPFHSLGFTVKTILPLLTGLRVAYTPDPTDAPMILEMLKHTKATRMATTPWFLKNVLDIAKPWDLDYIRSVLVWSDKCPDSIFEAFADKCPNWEILEWYGITECSPALAINPVGKWKMGSVGKILPNIDGRLIDLDIFNQDGRVEEVEQWQLWMLLVSWPNVFDGYRDISIKSPFVEYDGKKFYITGDLFTMDEEDYLFFKGRDSRVPKNPAGEFLDIPWVEEKLETALADEDVTISVCVDFVKHTEKLEWVNIPDLEKKWIKTFVFIDRKLRNKKIKVWNQDRDISVENINNFLFSTWEKMLKIDDIIWIDEIPSLWAAGKRDYQKVHKRLYTHLQSKA